MKLLGWELTRTKASVPASSVEDLVATGGGWVSLFRHVRESFTGAWQKGVEAKTENVLSYPTVYACISLIASDIGKVRVKLVEKDANGIWTETESPAFSPVLRQPNHYQTRVKFYEWWATSKLIHGNTYILKVRDNRRVVTGLYILDPCRVRTLVAPDMSVYYELRSDVLSGLEHDVVTVPASEIIHDVMVALFHPLVGVSPIFACAVAALHGLTIQNTSSNFFANGSRPGGIITAPGNISQAQAERIKEVWETNFSGDNAGKVAVLGDNMKYDAMAVSNVDAQLVEQLRWTDEKICSVFHVPPYMVGVGPMPTYNNIEALNQQYYSQCLQTLYESIEILLDKGLELPAPYGTEFDLDDLLKMDTATLIESAAKAVTAGVSTPNEARKRLNLPPLEGGNTTYMQEQQWPLRMLANRQLPTDAPADRPTEPAPLPGEPAKAWDVDLRKCLNLRRDAAMERLYAA